jgi:flagellar biosynthesis/type III secretory pathway M-ring protein FliF/YscJ
MDRLRKVLATITRHLGQLGTTQKLLVASLGVIAVMALFVVAQYTGRSDMAALLPGLPVADQQKAMPVLRAAGFKVEDRAGMVYIAESSRAAAQAQLAQSGQMPADTALMFRNIVDRQSWQMSRQQNDQLYSIALQNELAGVISHFSGVERATVIIDAPERQGLGAAVPRPTASATVFMRSGGSLEQAQVDAIAHLIAGARAGLKAEHVRVIDGTSGRQRKPTGDGEAMPTTYLEQQAKVESQMQAKLLELLQFIPGRIIAVTAQVDVTRSSSTTTSFLEKGAGTTALPKRTNETSETSTEAAPAAAPGLDSNVTADIARGRAAPGGRTDHTTLEKEMDNRVGSRTEEVVDPKGMPTMLAVSVNVPRSYVSGLIKVGRGPPADTSTPSPDPTDAEIVDKFAREVKPELVRMILPHVRAMSADSSRAQDQAALTKLLEAQVAVALIPLEGVPMSGGGGGAGTATGVLGPVGGVLALGGGMVEKVIVGLLALVSLGMMVMMVRKSSRTAVLPTPEELVGVPPKLEAPSDLMGEAEETDTPMAGIEVGEDQAAAAKVLEQVGEMVRKNPESAAKLINRWISVEH